ncbi:MAG: GNAT family N-acetyltransferase [Solobacterium sp.]|nr:GNAT family N-acetyltransferase [Solobacterium sp.]
MKFRVLEGEEGFDAVNLVKEVFFQEGNLQLSRQAAQSVLEYLSAKGELLNWFGAYDASLEGVIGYDDHYHICLFFIRHELQRQGIGTALFHAFLHEASAHAISRITVNALNSARPFYESLGFITYGETEIEHDLSTLPMEYLMGSDILGKSVTVTVDRPYGSLHPHYPDTEYPCNYGYVEEVLAGDGEFQDAYIVGIYEPVETFHGVVTAIIYRRDDSEAKWVVTPAAAYDRQEVIDAVGELEQYFDTHILWYEPQNA